MNFTIQDPKLLTGPQDEPYWTFWVRVFDLRGRWVEISGFRYWPVTGKLSTPAQKKDGTRYFNTVKVDHGFYGDLKKECDRILGGVTEEVGA